VELKDTVLLEEHNNNGARPMYISFSVEIVRLLIIFLDRRLGTFKMQLAKAKELFLLSQLKYDGLM
jgi:hypothetical protein